MGSAYAIPTKDAKFKRLPLSLIKCSVESFLEHASLNTRETFYVVAIGCGLAGYNPADIAPMFKQHPPNVQLAYELDAVLTSERATAELMGPDADR